MDDDTAGTLASMPGRLSPLVAWTMLLVAVLVAMAYVGGGPLSAPPLVHPAGLGEWAAARGGPAAALSIVRLVVMFTAGWLLVVTVVTTAVYVAGAGARLDVVDLLGLPIVR